ncbi:DUF6207 family protein [Streptomyces echinatus]|uniref:DUF6207 family protein n=1 Tax=Streptomyces echinatus TaxID=67293 RepID=UPI0037B17C81
MAELGLILVDIAAADKQTAVAFHTALAATWVTTAVERTSRDPGKPGVRLRCFLDMHRTL